MSDTIESRNITVDGIKYNVRLVSDLDGSIDDADCYTDEDKQAWRDGRWSFVGVIVSADIDGIDPAYVSASLWEVYYGTSPSWVIADVRPTGTVDLDELINVYPVPGMVSEVRSQLVKLRDKLPGIIAGLPTE